MGRVVYSLLATALLLCVPCSSHSTFPTPKDSKANNGAAKFRELRELSANASDYIVHLDAESYRTFALKSPRPYQMVVLFHSSNASLCRPCESFLRNLQQVVASYIAGGAYKRKDGLAPIVFAAVDIHRNSDVLQFHPIRGLPMLVNIDATTTLESDTKKKRGGFVKVGDTVMFKEEDIFQVLTKGPLDHQGAAAYTSERLLEWVNIKTSRADVSLVLPAGEKYKRLAILVALIAGGAFTFWFSLFICTVYPILRIVGSLLVYLLSSAGLFYSVQQGMQLAGFDRSTGGRIFIARSTRLQYAPEGFCMAGMTMVAGLSLVALTLAAAKGNDKATNRRRRVTKTQSNQGKGGEQPRTCDSSLGERVPNEGRGSEEMEEKRVVGKDNGESTQFIVIVLALAFVALVSCMFGVFRIKAPWYKPTFFPPSDYARGPIRVDRGNEF